jgi:hypothetical protein
MQFASQYPALYPQEAAAMFKNNYAFAGNHLLGFVQQYPPPGGVPNYAGAGPTINYQQQFAPAYLGQQTINKQQAPQPQQFLAYQPQQQIASHPHPPAHQQEIPRS